MLQKIHTIAKMQAPKFATPDVSHLSEERFKEVRFCQGSCSYSKVYEPAQDTFIVLDALEKERDWLLSELNPLVALEIGPGSGCIITFLAKLLGPDRMYFANDINFAACLATQLTSQVNQV